MLLSIFLILFHSLCKVPHHELAQERTQLICHILIESPAVTYLVLSSSNLKDMLIARTVMKK
jgi:hypothetical protein